MFRPNARFRHTNPIFVYDRRRARLNKPGFLHTQSVLLATFTTLAVTLIVVANLANNPSSSNRWQPQILPYVPLLTGIVFTLAAQIYCMAITVNTINSQMMAGQWDLLKLTTMDERDIIRAKYMVAAHRTRAAFIAVYLVNLAYYLGSTVYWIFPQLFVSGTPSMNGVPYPDYLPSYLLLILCLLFVAVYWLPFWEMRLVLAASLAISARIRNSMSAALTGLAAVLVLNAVMFCAVPPLIDRTVFSAFSKIDLLLAAIIATVSIGVVLYGLARLLAAIMLRLACYWAFRSE